MTRFIVGGTGDRRKCSWSALADKQYAAKRRCLPKAALTSGLHFASLAMQLISWQLDIIHITIPRCCSVVSAWNISSVENKAILWLDHGSGILHLPWLNRVCSPSAWSSRPSTVSATSCAYGHTLHCQYLAVRGSQLNRLMPSCSDVAATAVVGSEADIFASEQDYRAC